MGLIGYAVITLAILFGLFVLAIALFVLLKMTENKR